MWGKGGLEIQKKTCTSNFWGGGTGKNGGECPPLGGRERKSMKGGGRTVCGSSKGPGKHHWGKKGVKRK